MENKSKDYWEARFSAGLVFEYNEWLGDKVHKIPRNGKVLDLGCGDGRDAEYLSKAGCEVLACDFAASAIDGLKKRGFKNAFIFDMQEDDFGRFKTGEFDAVVASLSLHYFDSKTTFRIIYEIKRILKGGGYLFCRVNSTKDIVGGMGQGEMIAENLFVNPKRGAYKRFFSKLDVENFFSTFEKLDYKEKEVLYNNNLKFLFEITAQKL